MGKTKDDITGEELGEKLLHAVREMKAGYAARTTEYADAAVEDFQRTIYFYRKVDVTRCVDNVETGIFPKTADCR